LATALSASPDEVTVGETTTLTGSVTNPYGVALELDEITLQLTDAVTYVADSASDIGEPTIAENILTFVGPFSIPANGSFTFTVDVETASTSEQTFTLNGNADNITVVESTATLNIKPLPAPTPEP